MGAMRLLDIASYLGSTVSNGSEYSGREILRVAAPESARETDLVFAQEEGPLLNALNSPAGAILASERLRQSAAGGRAERDGRVLWVPEARLAFAKVAERLQPQLAASEVHPSAIVAAGAQLGERLRIGAGAILGDDVIVGDDCVLDARVVLYPGSRLGRRVVVQAGAVLGSAGFGYVRDAATGKYSLFPQQGTLVIEDDVSIGANCTIDRGALARPALDRDRRSTIWFTLRTIAGSARTL